MVGAQSHCRIESEETACSFTAIAPTPRDNFTRDGGCTAARRRFELEIKQPPNHSGHILGVSHRCAAQHHDFLSRLPLTASIASLLVYILGLWFTQNFILVFVLTVVLLSFDFYYLKNIAGRRLVGLRWWNEVNPQTGDSHWVFESADPETRTQNATDRRFFWLALYAQPALWVLMGVVAIIKIISLQELTPLWITLVGT